MDREQYEAAEPHLDEIAELLDEILEGGMSAKLNEALAKVGQVMGLGYSVELNIVVGIFDHRREKSLPLVTTGLAASDGKEPYRTWGDSSPQRYIVDGEMLVVPHDYCPKCWDRWDFKWKFPSCDHCGAALGKEVKILLDTDVCPYCEKGKVTAAKPTCDRCGYHVDSSVVVWG